MTCQISHQNNNRQILEWTSSNDVNCRSTAVKIIIAELIRKLSTN